MIKRNNHQLSLIGRSLELPVSYPVFTLFVCLAFIVVTTVGAKDLYFRGDYNVFFDEANQQLKAFDEIQSRFAKSDSLVVVIAPESGDIFNPETLKLIQELTEEAWQTPYSSRVDSLANYQHTEAFEDDLLVDDLLSAELTFTSPEINKVRQIALTEPVTRHSLVSESGDVAVINITVQLPEVNKTAEVAEVYHFVTDLIDRYQQQYSDIQFYKTGLVALNYAFMVSAQEDISTLVPAMLLVVLLFLTVLLRSYVSVIATLVVIICSVITTLGLSGWFGIAMTIATVNIPTLVLTLAIADCVHIIATMRYQMEKGVSQCHAILNSLKVNALPVIITSVTTAIGFYMMNMSDSPVLRDFGSLAALGVMIACVLSLTLLPALLRLIPVRVKPTTKTSRTDLQDRLADFVIAHKKALSPVFVVLIALSAVLIPINKVGDDSVKYFHKTSEFRLAADYMQEHISGVIGISVAVDSKQPQGIVAPVFLKTMDAFTGWLREQPEVDHVASLTDILKRLNKNMHADKNRYYRLPESRELAAQYLLMYEMSLPYGLDLNNQINIDKSALKIQVTADNLGSTEMVDLENRIYQWFNENTPSGETYQVTASSPFLMFAHIGEANIKSMLISLPISLLLISGLLVLALSSFKLGMLSIIPNMVPALVGFGFWALISGEINLGLSVVASLTLGIVVDDAVHFLTKYKIARRKGKSAEDSVHYAFHTVGRALWVTTVVLIAGFSVLAMSSFRLNSDMGQLSSMVIFLALLVDFFFLPCLLMLLDTRMPDKKSGRG